MTMTIEVPERVAEFLARIPEGEARDNKVVEWLEQGAEGDAFFESVDTSPLTDVEKNLLLEGVADIAAGRYRPLREALADFRLLCAREKAERGIAK